MTNQIEEAFYIYEGGITVIEFEANRNYRIPIRESCTPNRTETNYAPSSKLEGDVKAERN